MKKISVLLLAIMMLFAFTACDDASGLKEMNVSVRLGQHVRGAEEDHNNWKQATVSMEDDVVTVHADLDAMEKYASSVTSQGEAMWLALLIDTGISDLENVVYNGTPLGEAGANEYKDLKGVDGVEGKSSEMVLWIKADDSTTYAEGRKITLGADGFIEKSITIKVEDVDFVETAEDFTTAISKGKEVILTADITLSEKINFTKSVDIDLNGKTLSTDLDLNINENATAESEVVNVNISNGKLVLNSKIEGHETHGTLRLYTNSNVTLTNVEYTTDSTGIFFRQNNADAKAVIKDSKIISTGSYAIGTNASKEESENMFVEIENSTISAAEEGATGILFNVNGGVTIKDSTVIGGKQAMIARGGIHSFTNTTFEAKDAAPENDEYLDNEWATGNGVPVAVLVVGNRNSGSSYPYGTTVTLDSVTFTAPEDVLGIYVYQNKDEEAVSVKGTVTALPSVNTDSMNDATYEVAVK